MILSFIVLIRIFSNAITNVYQKKLIKKIINPFLINFLVSLIVSIFCILLLNINLVDNLNSKFWLYSILSGVFNSLGNGFLIKSLQNGELSVLVPINSYKPLIALFINVFFLKEFVNLISLLGLLFILIGSYFVINNSNTSNNKISSHLKTKSILYRILALIFTAIEAVVIKEMIINSSILQSLFFWSIFGAIFSFILFLITFKKDFKTFNKLIINKTNIINLIYLAIFFGIMQLSTNYIFSKLNVGLALSLFQLSILLSLFFGYKYFNEKINLKKIFGTVIMITGAIIIILLA